MSQDKRQDAQIALALAMAGRGGPFGPTATLRIPFATAGGSSSHKLPPGAYVFRSWIEIDTPFTPGAGVRVGQPGFPSAFQSAGTDNDPELAADFLVAQPIPAPANDVVDVQVIGAPVAGSGVCFVEFAVPAA